MPSSPSRPSANLKIKRRDALPRADQVHVVLTFSLSGSKAKTMGIEIGGADAGSPDSFRDGPPKGLELLPEDHSVLISH